MTDHSPDHAERAREMLIKDVGPGLAAKAIKTGDSRYVRIRGDRTISMMLAYADERVAAALRGRGSVVDLEEAERIELERSLTDPAAIAAGLTKAQREAVLLFDAADFEAAHPARRAAMMTGLGKAGVRPIYDAGLITKPDQPRGISSRLTPLGLAVRATLHDATVRENNERKEPPHAGE